MKRLYIRWAVLAFLFGVIGVLGAVRYNREVKAISPKALLASPKSGTLRLIGRVEPGTLIREKGGKFARFTLAGEGVSVPVQFAEDDQETLRELKTIVVIGKWDSENQRFNAGEIALVPNYGFIASAYLAALVPLGLFLFHMERKVAILYIRIKEEKVYKPEVSG